MPESECILWEGRVAANGYGRKQIGRKFYKAHRWVLEQHLGRPLRADEFVHHKCHNLLCVNVEHLEIMSHGAHSSLHFTGVDRSGERNGFAKLKRADVVAVRQALARGESRASVAARHGVSPSCIWQIATGRTWKDA